MAQGRKRVAPEHEEEPPPKAPAPPVAVKAEEPADAKPPVGGLEPQGKGPGAEQQGQPGQAAGKEEPPKAWIPYLTFGPTDSLASLAAKRICYVMLQDG